MKKILFSLFVFSCVVFNCVAEVATIKHSDGEIEVFYTVNALKDALAVADTGDVINLSSGYFIIERIEKPVSIIGAGMENDTINGINSTHIFNSGTYIYFKQTSDAAVMKLEGLCFDNVIYLYRTTVNNLTATRCKFTKHFNYNNSSDSWLNCNFVNCLFTSSDYTYMYGNCTFLNCYMYKIDENNGYHTYLNCIVKLNSSSYDKSNFTNCVCIRNSSSYVLRNFNSCVAISDNGNYPLGNPALCVPNYESLFKSFTGTYTEGEKFELTDEAAAKWLGTDGTQVGLYGGYVPYDPKPTNIQIEKCTVDKQTDENGKLNVTIKLKK